MLSARPPVAPLDRRQRRRAQTIEEIVDVALELIAREGAAGLSLGEVARRMGMRTPSLYGYFSAKNALYDVVFARGWTELTASLEPLTAATDRQTELEPALVALGATFVRWAGEHPGYSQLMFWRPVPGYQPSPDAYAAAVHLLARAHDVFGGFQERGLVRPDADLDEVVRTWTVLMTGIVTQHATNEPAATFDEGSFTALVPVAAQMMAARYGPDTRRLR
jgi:AcrR family transcriptional regulator